MFYYDPTRMQTDLADQMCQQYMEYCAAVMQFWMRTVTAINNKPLSRK